MLPSRSALLTAVAGLAATAAAASVRSLSSDSLAAQCHISLEGQRFDLCPLLKANEGKWIVDDKRLTPPTETKYTYQLSLHGPLKQDKDIPDYEQCADGTWICLTVNNRNPHGDSNRWRVLQAVPVAGDLSTSKEEPSDLTAEKYVPGIQLTAALTPTLEDSKHDVLHLHLHGGYYVKQQQKAVLAFVCDHNAEEPTSPAFAWNWNGTHTLEWRTKHACGQSSTPATSTSNSKPKTTSSPDAEPEPEPAKDTPPKEDKSKEKKLVDPDLAAGRRSMMMVITSASAIAVLMYLMYYPPRRVRRFLTSFVKAHPRMLHARVPQRVLVRWAYEDLEFERGEEDMMVNAEEERPAPDEQIPLKPSPRQSALIDYGSAR